MRGGKGALNWRFAPVHRRNSPGGPALARLGPPGGRLDRLRSGARPAGARGRPVPAFGGHPEKRKTAASGARPPSARAAPRRPSLVDSLCAGSFPLISI